MHEKAPKNAPILKLKAKPSQYLALPLNDQKDKGLIRLKLQFKMDKMSFLTLSLHFLLMSVARAVEKGKIRTMFRKRKCYND